MAEATGDVVAEGERVQAAGGQRREGGAGEDEREHLPGDADVPAGEAADHPEPVLLEGAGVDAEQRVHDGAETRVEGRADQREGDRAGALAGAVGHGEDQQPGEQRAGDAEPDVPGERAHAEDGDGQHHAEGRAGADPEDARLGERVAGDGLEEHPGQGQGQPDDQPQGGTRHPQLADHGGGLAAVRGDQGVPHLVDREVPAAERQAGQQRDDEQERRRQSDREAAGHAAAGGGVGAGGPDGDGGHGGCSPLGLGTPYLSRAG
ncbi:hypothetical protein B0E53_07058 [Micromonospora sp. MH33]|nr:hypothetical protein B0E53_07058 [Micromonospora sp. MH33]